MARTGITQDDVNRAADALVGRGERPTIERVRAELGTGSPNTLIRLLDGWWSGLAERLRSHAHAITLPEAPDDVVSAASHLWTRSLEIAEAHASERHENERHALETERVAFAERENQRGAELAAALDRAASAEARLADVQRLADSHAGHAVDLQRQRDASLAALDDVRDTLKTAQAEHTERIGTLLREREAADAQYRAAEARWMRETDRARQEAAGLQRQLERQKTEHARDRTALSDELKALHSELRTSERQRAAREAEVQRLERELDRTRSALAAVGHKSRKRPPSKTRSKAQRP